MTSAIWGGGAVPLLNYTLAFTLQSPFTERFPCKNGKRPSLGTKGFFKNAVHVLFVRTGKFSAELRVRYNIEGIWGSFGIDK